MLRRFLAGPRFRSDFKPAKTRKIFYRDIRCGLLHQAEAKNKWLVRRKQPTMLKKVGADGYIVGVERFHKAIRDSLEDYFSLLSKPESTDLRDKLSTKMDHICNVRASRGAMETLDTAAAQPTA